MTNQAPHCTHGRRRDGTPLSRLWVGGLVGDAYIQDVVGPWSMTIYGAKSPGGGRVLDGMGGGTEEG